MAWLTPRAMQEADDASALIADIGGTNVRFALAEPDGQITHILSLRTKDYGSLADAAEIYLEGLSDRESLSRAAFAVASPITGDTVRLTNNAWSFRINDLKVRLGLEKLTVVNDFAAIALSLPHLTAADMVPIGPTGTWADPLAIHHLTRGVLGPGTGLGVAGLIAGAPAPDPDDPDDDAGLVETWREIDGEGGHVTLPASDAREEKIVAELRSRFAHVSAERALSGPGLVNLHAAVAAVNDDAAPAASAAEIATRAADKSCPICIEAVEVFTGMLGSVAGDLALTLGARGGIFIAGGVVPKLGPAFDHALFRERFEDKGRFKSYLEKVPTWLTTLEVPAFPGLAWLARGRRRASGTHQQPL